MSDEPYCNNCGYVLTGLVESSKCPECGRPLVEVLRRTGAAHTGKRWQSATRVFGWPLMVIAFGPSGTEKRGHAKGIIAVGDIATGFLAIGGWVRGIVALGGGAVGCVAIGGLSVGLVTAFGGVAIAGLAVGGIAGGVVAQGGMSVGILVDGGLACGYLARGGEARGAYTIDSRGASPGAKAVSDRWAWLIGSTPPSRRLIPLAVAAAVAVTLLTAVVVMLGYVIGSRSEPEHPDS
ncbi:MAG: hypothetical protein GY778_29805 [bacterium]|nr:hypothetical protein [bacterium]